MGLKYTTIFVVVFKSALYSTYLLTYCFQVYKAERNNHFNGRHNLHTFVLIALCNRVITKLSFPLNAIPDAHNPVLAWKQCD